MNLPFRRWTVNAFIAAMLAILAVDALPQSPAAVQLMVQPWLFRLGIRQGPWNMFAPEPDRVNRRLRAEITYRDGTKAEWMTPIWNKLPAGEVFLNYRRRAWWDRMISPDLESSWAPTCRYLARVNKPAGVPDIQGAKVLLIYSEAPVPPAEDRPWPSVREAIPYDAGWILTTQTIE